MYRFEGECHWIFVYLALEVAQDVLRRSQLDIVLPGPFPTEFHFEVGLIDLDREDDLRFAGFEGEEGLVTGMGVDQQDEKDDEVQAWLVFVKIGITYLGLVLCPKEFSLCFTLVGKVHSDEVQACVLYRYRHRGVHHLVDSA